LSSLRPTYITPNQQNAINIFVERVEKVKQKENLDTLKYVPHWRVKKFRSQRLLIHMLDINQAIVVFPWWRPDLLRPLCVKCGGLTYPIHKPCNDDNAFFLCYNSNCDFVMHTNYK